MKVLAGDLSFPQGPHYIKINDIVFIENRYSNTGQILEIEKEACANDGIFTIQIGKPYSQEELNKFDIGNELGLTMINALYYKKIGEQTYSLIDFGQST